MWCDVYIYDLYENDADNEVVGTIAVVVGVADTDGR